METQKYLNEGRILDISTCLCKSAHRFLAVCGPYMQAYLANQMDSRHPLRPRSRRISRISDPSCNNTVCRTGRAYGHRPCPFPLSSERREETPVLSAQKRIPGK